MFKNNSQNIFLWKSTQESSKAAGDALLLTQLEESGVGKATPRSRDVSSGHGAVPVLRIQRESICRAGVSHSPGKRNAASRPSALPFAQFFSGFT